MVHKLFAIRANKKNEYAFFATNSSVKNHDIFISVYVIVIFGIVTKSMIFNRVPTRVRVVHYGCQIQVQ